MANTLMSLLVKIGADTGELTNALNNSESATKRWAQKTSASLMTYGESLSNIGKSATMFISLPLALAGAAAVNFASDLEETKNKVIVVFGEMSDSIMSWSETSATAMGMSQNTALAATGTFGNLFTTMGIGAGASADMSMGLVKLAADLASFNNIDPTEVLDKLRSGLVGEVEPLRALGINLSQAAVEAKAMEMGLVGVDDVITPAILAQARYALILEQSTNAAGDFQRTAEGLANQQRILKAQFQNAAAALGKQLLPYMLKLVTWVSGLIEKFQALTPEQQKWIVVIGAVVAAVGPLLMIIGSIATALGAIIPVITAVAGVLTFPLIAIILAVVAVVALLYAAWTNNWGGIQEKTMAIWAWLQPILIQLWTWLSTTITSALAVLANYWTNVLLPAITVVWGFVSGTLWPLFLALADLLGAVLGLAIRVLAGIWQNILQPALMLVWNWLKKVYEQVQPVINIFERLGRNLVDYLIPTMEDAKEVISALQQVFNRIAGAVASVIKKIRDLADALTNMELPDWLTPGSPTPFEMGLLGIGQAMQQLSSLRLPNLSTGLELLPTMPLGGMAMQTVNGGTMTPSEYNVTVNATVANDVDIESLAYRIADVIARRTR